MGLPLSDRLQGRSGEFGGGGRGEEGEGGMEKKREGTLW